MLRLYADSILKIDIIVACCGNNYITIMSLLRILALAVECSLLKYPFIQITNFSQMNYLKGTPHSKLALDFLAGLKACMCIKCLV